MIDEIEHAISIAKRSQLKKHRTGCVIYRDDTFVSNGWSHTGHWRVNQPYSVHAEIHAILRGRHMELGDSVAYIATVSGSGKITKAAPCLACATTLVGYGIESVVYTRSGGGTSSMYLPEAIALNQLKVYNKRV